MACKISARIRFRGVAGLVIKVLIESNVAKFVVTFLIDRFEGVAGLKIGRLRQVLLYMYSHYLLT